LWVTTAAKGITLVSYCLAKKIDMTVDGIFGVMRPRSGTPSAGNAPLGVLAQRVARIICGRCKEAYQPTKEELDGLAYGYGEAAFAQPELPRKENLVLYRGKVCADCHQRGYIGRIGLHELLVVSDEIKRLIHAPAQPWLSCGTWRLQGMTTFVQDGVQKVLDGWTDYGQVKAASTWWLSLNGSIAISITPLALR
jgi:hypothetical protein